MSDDEKKDYKVQFAPGCLDTLENELSPQELQEFMDKISEMVKDGSFFENSVPINMDTLEEEDPDLYKILSEIEEGNLGKDNPTLH